MTTTLDYPEDVLPLPTFDGYAIDPQDPVNRTDMEQGPARQVLLYTAVPEGIPVRFRFTQWEYAVFRSWIKHKANFGAAWFNITLLTGLGMVSHEVRFYGQGNSPYKAVPQRGGWWVVTTRFEVRDSPDLSEEALDVALVEDIPGLIAIVNDIDGVVNTSLAQNPW